MFKVPNRNAVIFLCSVIVILACRLPGKDQDIDHKGKIIAFQKGLDWMREHPQRIEENVELYTNELLFYYLMIERSRTEKEREWFKEIFLQRLRQSDGFNFTILCNAFTASSI